MASLITVRIDKGNSPNLGFRLQGGKDFGTPLVIQKVNGGSPAERAGLIAGDSVIKINNIDVFNLRHKDAQDVVVRAGPSFEIALQRGGSTWKPSVIPTGPLHSPATNFNNVSPVTRTSLSSNRNENIGSIGTGHNLSAKPFNPQVNGAVNGGPKLVNKQYNTPLKLYSEESIAETLSAQTEVLSTGALGVNFKKNERNYDASNSEVLRALKEAENEPNYSDQEPDSGVVTAPNSGIAGLRRVQAPENRPQPPTPQLPPGQNICADCERLIVGVFVRIKDKNLHVECFKCSTCGTSLKNVGYYNISNKLYCDVHAKSAALKHQANPNLVPITIPSGGRAPAHAISSALSSHSYPTLSPLSPKINNSGSQYQADEFKENVDVASVLPILAQSNVIDSNASNNNLFSNSTPLSFSSYLNKTSNYSGPKPFSNVSAPLSPHNTLSRAPLSPIASTPAPSFNQSFNSSAYSPSSGRFPTYNKPAGGLFKVQVAENIIWPPYQIEPEIPTACPLFYPPPSQVEQKIINKKKEKQENEIEEQEYCSEIEVINSMAHVLPNRRRSTDEFKGTLAGALDTQMLVENVIKTRISSPVPSVDKNELPKCSNSPLDDVCCKSNHSPIPVHAAPLKWESPLTQAIRTTSPDKDTFACIPTKHSSTALATALSVAPLEPFTPHTINEDPVPLPEETIPYFPPERPVLTETSAPVPSIRKKFGPADKLLEDLPKPEEKLSMLSALTTASDRPYSPFIEPISQEKNVKRSNLNTSIQQPDVLPESFVVNKKEVLPPSYYPPSVLYEKTEEAINTEQLEESSSCSSTRHTTIQKQTIQQPEVRVILDENHNQTQIAPLFHGFSCSFQNKGDISQFSVDVRTTPPIISPPPLVKTIEKPEYSQIETISETKSEKKQTKKEEKTKSIQREEKITLKQAEEIIPVKAVPPIALRKPTQLPQYQVELSAEAESELLLFEKKKQATSVSQKDILPAIKVQVEDINRTFKPVVEERVPSHTFSPRPGSITPSRISGKPPSILPYYQTNLVPQKMLAAHSNVFDPKNPEISRSPSPMAMGAKERSPSPLPGTKSNIRAVSPVPGPPENPLTSSTPLPNPESIRVDQARESLTNYLPDYKSRRDVIEETEGINTQMYTSHVQTQNYPTAQIQAMQRSELHQAQKSEKNISQQDDTCISISKEEKLRQAHLEQMTKSEQQTVEQSADGLTQIQRKRIVTEEYERSQKELNIQIEKNVTTSKKYPFSDVNPPLQHISNTGGHITDPQRISSSFLKTRCTQIENCLKQRNPALAPFTPIANASASSKHDSDKFASPPDTSKKPNVSSVSSQPNAGTTSGRQTAGVKVAPRRGRGILNPAAIGGARVPLCGGCNMQVRGPFITALGKIWCPNHFICSTPSCRRPLQDIGFVEERGQLYCEYCFEQYLAPPCSKCGGKIKGDCLKAIGKNFHPECFNCTYCGKLFGNSPFFLEDGSPYCEADWNELFTTKCYACAFPIEAGDRWVEALSNNYHSQCFNCTMCKKNLEGQSFFAKGGRPFCKNHAR